MGLILIPCIYTIIARIINGDAVVLGIPAHYITAVVDKLSHLMQWKLLQFLFLIAKIIYQICKVCFLQAINIV